jgi:hypothetical protein
MNCNHTLIERVSEEEKRKHNGALVPYWRCYDCGQLFYIQRLLEPSISYGWVGLKET